LKLTCVSNSPADLICDQSIEFIHFLFIFDIQNLSKIMKTRLMKFVVSLTFVLMTSYYGYSQFSCSNLPSDITITIDGCSNVGINGTYVLPLTNCVSTPGSSRWDYTLNTPSYQVWVTSIEGWGSQMAYRTYGPGGDYVLIQRDHHAPMFQADPKRFVADFSSSWTRSAPGVNCTTPSYTQCLLYPSVTASSLVTCNGLSTGTATINPGGGNSPFTYSWGSGNSTTANTTATLTGFPAGTFTVTVSDNVCSKTVGVTITEPTALLASAVTDVNVVCKGEATGKATASAIGGPSTSYSYSWSNGATTASASGLTAGVYTVTVSSELCSDLSSVTITEPATAMMVLYRPSFHGTTNISTRGGQNGFIRTWVKDGDAPYTYDWTGPGNPPNNADIFGLKAGKYWLEVTGASGCKAYGGPWSLIEP
jgi:hypothetical protein